MKTNEVSQLAQVIRERRSIKGDYTDKPVSEETVIELLEDAIWAPTHGMRQPWRFIFVGSEEKQEFARKIAATYPAELQKNREDYLNEPTAILVVIMEAPDFEKQWDENFGATASMIHNFSLLAWEKNLGVCWKTNPHIYDKAVKKLLGVSDNEKIVGFLHLGYFEKAPEKRERVSAKEKFIRFSSVEQAEGR